jgi:hypothetical protein
MILISIRKRLKLFSVLSSLILLLPTTTSTQACVSYPEPEELRYMLFNPDMLHKKEWWSFFYNERLNYLDGRTLSADDENLLTAEWIKQMQVKEDPKEAWNCLFGSLPDSLLRQNSFYAAIQKQPAFANYFAVARRSEQLVGTSLWEMTEKEGAVLMEQRHNEIDTIQKILAKETSPFFKKKYAFQLVKLAYYANDKPLFDSLYNQYFQQSNKEVLEWWAMHYKSMRLEEEQKVDSANYLHALVFSHSSNKKFVSKQYFSKKRLGAVLALAQNDAERADIYLLSEVINPGRSLEGMAKVYRYAPNHPHLPLLIGREINKLEDWLGSTKYANARIATDFWGEKPLMGNWQRDFAYLNTFIHSLQQMPALAKAYPDFYALSMAYLHLMKGDPKAAGTYLIQVNVKDPDLFYQHQVMKVILTVQQNDITNAAVQDEIGALYQSLLTGRARKFESQKMLYSLSSYLRYTFANKGLVHLAGLFDNLAINKFCNTCGLTTFEYSQVRYFDLFASASDVEKLIHLYEQPAKNKLEEVLLKPYSNKNYLYDLLSVKYLREGNVKQAKAALQHIPDEFWFSFSNASYNLDRDPFLDNKELLSIQTMVTYNKREILEKMDVLEQEAETHPDKRAQNYFRLGNAWYNFSAHSWFMISYGMTVGETDNPAYGSQARKRALGYYKKALPYESQNENKIKLLYMIALLSDKRNKTVYAKEYEQYNTTEFYRNRSCLTLSDLAESR